MSTAPTTQTVDEAQTINPPAPADSATASSSGIRGDMSLARPLEIGSTQLRATARTIGSELRTRLPGDTSKPEVAQETLEATPIATTIGDTTDAMTIATIDDAATPIGTIAETTGTTDAPATTVTTAETIGPDKITATNPRAAKLGPPVGSNVPHRRRHEAAICQAPCSTRTGTRTTDSGRSVATQCGVKARPPDPPGSDRFLPQS